MKRTHPSPMDIKLAIYTALNDLSERGGNVPAGIFEAVDEGICKANLAHDKRMEESK